ncbi:MAG: hypothetical protein ISEC1_P0620 [Thiomicrorhabdus sp.]|nr:MAG: hypothetical protein ISEC1_P0620 [Thiomicrorhabdus sp.]
MDWSAITGISSSIIALCALAYTAWQGIQTREHNKLSFRPHITSWSYRNSESGVYVTEVMNNGLGPALIESFTVKVDGKVISGNNTDVIEKA